MSLISLLVTLLTSKKVLREYKNGKTLIENFEENNFDVKIIGLKRIKSSLKRWRFIANNYGINALKDKRGKKSNKKSSLLKENNKLKKENAMYLNKSF